MDLFDLSGKVAVVTGGLGQLGQNFCCALARQGAEVAILDRREQAETAIPGFSELVANGRIRVRLCDISSRASVKEAADWLIERYGTVDILINNAGLDSPPDA